MLDTALSHALMRLCAQYKELRDSGRSVSSDLTLFAGRACGLKYQRVQLVPGLSGVVCSDDGKSITVQYQDVAAWLTSH